jgi:SAM-dependent methyltransferase
MSDPEKGYRIFDHDAHARSVPPDDFWGQIRRTVGGRPVADEQIGLIVEAIVSGLQLGTDDRLLDLACGNGALSARVGQACGSLLGVDSSEYLIEVARKNFERPPGMRFERADAAEYAASEQHPEDFTKALCYGSFSYFPEDTAVAVLEALRSRFIRVSRVLVGNLPDRDRMGLFYSGRAPALGETSDPQSQIGVWRSRQEFAALAARCGWNATFREMPPAFYAAHYRYDAVLTRAE